MISVSNRIRYKLNVINNMNHLFPIGGNGGSRVNSMSILYPSNNKNNNSLEIPLGGIGSGISGGGIVGKGGKNIVVHHCGISIHGIIMIFFVAMVVLISGSNNIYIGILYGINEVIYPRINNMSIGILLVAINILLGGINIRDGYRYGWTMYPPISTINNIMGVIGVELICIVLLLAGISSTLTGVNILVSANMKIKCSGVLNNIYIFTLNITNILLLIVLPSLTVLLTILIGDSLGNMCVWNYRRGGDCVLYQHLFWFFGHPEVYILILPCFACVNLGMCTRVDKSLMHAVILIAIIGMVVWIHHMYTSNIIIDTRVFHNITSVLIGGPTILKLSALNRSTIK